MYNWTEIHNRATILVDSGITTWTQLAKSLGIPRKTLTEGLAREYKVYRATQLGTEEVIEPIAPIPLQRFAVASDLHFGSKASQITRLQEFVQQSIDMGVDTVFVPGDVFAGDRVYRGQEREVYASGPEEQVDAAVNSLPEGVTYYIIGGNHDFSHIKVHGVDAVRWLCSQRDDCVFLGYDEGTVNLRTDAKGLNVRMYHGEGGLTQSSTWKGEKYAREVVLARQEDIDVVLVGHFHTFGYVFPGVDVFMCGSFESTTAWLRRKGKRATVGGIIFELGEGNETVLVPRFIRYEPIENDWVKHFRIFY